MRNSFTNLFTRSLLMAILVGVQWLSAQSLGDIVFTGFNADGNDGFAIVTLVDIPANTTIWFTDEEWDNVTLQFTSTGSEGDVSWSNSVLTPAGTVIDFGALSSTPTASVGTVTASINGGTALSSSNEQIYVYLGALRAPTTFLTVFANATLTASQIPAGMTVGTNIMQFGTGMDVGAYVGPRLGQATFPGYIPGLYDLTNNWITQDGSGDQHNDGIAPDVPFDVTPFVLGNLDLIPPTPVSASMDGPTMIEIPFNEVLDTPSATNTANYMLSPSIAVSAAALVAADTVKLTLAGPLSDGIQYTLTVSNVADTAGNAMTTPVDFGLIYNATTPDLVITEIMYNNPSEDTLEFFEIYNHGTGTALLGGLELAAGVSFVFEEQSLAPGGIVLIAGDTSGFKNFFGITADGEFSGSAGNGGETILIVNSLGDTIDEVSYDDAAPWPLGPPTPDGGGPSIELIDPDFDNNVGSNWQISTNLVGQDGAGNDIWASPDSVGMFTTGLIALDGNVRTVSEDADSVEILVTLTGSSSVVPTAKVVLTSLSTATNQTDFNMADTVTVTFQANVAADTFRITVPITDDSDSENDEYFSVRLIEAVNASTGNTTEMIYIKDNDREAPVGSEALNLTLLTSFDIDPGGSNAAEILAFEPQSQRVFVSNSDNNSVDIVNLANPNAPVDVRSIDINPYGDINSVAVFDTIVACAVANSNDVTLPGFVVFFDTAGNFISQVTVGALPDMVTFTPSGDKALAALEGEPADDYTVDPEGGVAIIDMTVGVDNLTNADVKIAGFTGFNGSAAALRSNGVRITGPDNTSVAQDMEPEYITVADDGLTAWVACQENNAVAVLDLVNDTITTLVGGGTKDFSVAGVGLDATNNFDSINIANYPFKSLYMPDAITNYEFNGDPYLITANEGDSREYSAYVDETRLSGITLDSATFPNGDILQKAVGRIKVVNTEGDIDNDGDIDEITLFGGRSFTIWNGTTGVPVYDSGDDFELITSQDPVYGAIFNANDDGVTPKNRSDDKGPEPEAITVGTIGGRIYAFVGLERIGGIMVYDVTTPTSPEFVRYTNNRSITNGNVGDLAPEGIQFVPSSQSPNGRPLLLIANEVSSTMSVYEVTEAVTGEVSFVDAQQTVDEDVDSVTITLAVNEDRNVDSTILVDVVLGGFATADASADFGTMMTTTVSFPPAVDTVSFKIGITNDSDAENDEYFSLRLVNPVSANFGAEESHIVFILDDDREAPVPTKEIELKLVTSYKTGIIGDDAAEIVAYDSASQRLFVANSEANDLDIIDFSDPTTPTTFASIDLDTYGEINSVAVYNGIVALAIQDDDKTMPGKIVFFDNAGTFVSQVNAGALPDMITFTPDGTTVLTANEGEPNNDYSVDPEGSISIVDISGGVANVTQADVSTADFTAFNAQETQLKAAGVRIFGPGATVAQDLEPEYIALNANGDTAYVTLQENNALAIVDVANATVLNVLALGLKDHNLAGNGGIDAEDRSDFIRLANYPIKGMYMPDAITTYAINGKTYLVTANEGDAREYDTYEEEVRLGDEDYELDPTAFPDGDLLKAAIGRITTTFASGDTDGDGDYDEVHVFGSRSFTIWDANTGAITYDSDDDFELITSRDSVFGAIFNTTDDELEPKNRSDNKGPEPEAVVVTEIEGEQYAFVGLERIGGVMVYNVTDPTSAEFIQYVNNRSTTNDTLGDLAPESILLIPTTQSPDGKYYVVVANEVSSTLAIYEIDSLIISTDAKPNLALRIYPNPAMSSVTVALPQGQSQAMNIRVIDLQGRVVMQTRGIGATEMELSHLNEGIYIIDVATATGRAQQRLVVR